MDRATQTLSKGIELVWYRRKAVVISVAVLVALFVVFVPVVQLAPSGPAYFGIPLPVGVYVSLSHYLFGFGGFRITNLAGPSPPYDYRVDW